MREPGQTVLLTPPSSLVKSASELEEVPLDTVLDIVISYLELVTQYYQLVDSHNGLVDWIKTMESKHGSSTTTSGTEHRP